MLKNLEVACIQMAPKLREKVHNVQRMLAYISVVMEERPDTRLIVFPELATTGYECCEAFEGLAEDQSDKEAYALAAMKAAAHANGVHIIFGYPERHGAKIYNAQVCIDDQGAIIGNYRKVHLFDSEKKYFQAGDSYTVVNSALGRIGLFICYDASFPEVARILALKGAEILVNSTNWEIPAVMDMDIVMTARAFENTCYLVCANRVGTDEALTFFGHSMILDPVGRQLARAEEPVEAILYACLESERLKGVRNNYYTMLKERRTDTYGPLYQ